MTKVLIQGDWLDGFSSGRKASLLDWQFRKEQREGIAGAPSFAILVNRLRARKWAKDNPERANARALRWTKTPKGKAFAKAYRKKRRRAKNAATVYTCLACGATWCKAPWIRGPRPNFCSVRCQQRHRYANDEAFRERAKKNALSQHAKKRSAA